MTEYVVASRSAEGDSKATGRASVDCEAEDVALEPAAEAPTEAAAEADGRASDQPDDGQAARRAALIAAAQPGWIDALTDLGGRNTLL